MRALSACISTKIRTWGRAAVILLALTTATANAESILPPQVATRESGTNVQIQLTSQSNIVYRIVARTELTSGSWRAIRAGIAETTQTDVDIVPYPGLNNYYRVKASTLYPIPNSSETWHRTASNPDCALRIRGYLIYYPNVLQVALEMIDLTTGQWKAVLKSSTGSAANYVGYPRDVSPDGEVVVHGHDNALLYPEREHYLYIRQVTNTAQKVVVTIPEPLESIRFNEDSSITVNGQFTYTRDGDAI